MQNPEAMKQDELALVQALAVYFSNIAENAGWARDRYLADLRKRKFYTVQAKIALEKSLKVTEETTSQPHPEKDHCVKKCFWFHFAKEPALRKNDIPMASRVKQWYQDREAIISKKLRRRDCDQYLKSFDISSGRPQSLPESRLDDRDLTSKPVYCSRFPFAHHRLFTYLDEPKLIECLALYLMRQARIGGWADEKKLSILEEKWIYLQYADHVILDYLYRLQSRVETEARRIATKIYPDNLSSCRSKGENVKMESRLSRITREIVEMDENYLSWKANFGQTRSIFAHDRTTINRHMQTPEARKQDELALIAALAVYYRNIIENSRLGRHKNCNDLRAGQFYIEQAKRGLERSLDWTKQRLSENEPETEMELRSKMKESLERLDIEVSEEENSGQPYEEDLPPNRIAEMTYGIAYLRAMPMQFISTGWFKDQKAIITKLRRGECDRCLTSFDTSSGRPSLGPKTSINSFELTYLSVKDSRCPNRFENFFPYLEEPKLVECLALYLMRQARIGAWADEKKLSILEEEWRHLLYADSSIVKGLSDFHNLQDSAWNECDRISDEKKSQLSRYLNDKDAVKESGSSAKTKKIAEIAETCVAGLHRRVLKLFTCA